MRHQIRLFLLCLAMLAVACDDGGVDQPGPDTTNTSDTSDTTQPPDTAPDMVDASDVEPDTTPSAPWAGCPDSTDHVGDASWPLRVVVGDAALYCGLANEGFYDWESMSVDWARQRAWRSQLWLAPGEYALPQADGTYAFSLPMCTLFDADDRSPQPDGAGTLTVSSTQQNGTTYLSYSYLQPMRTADGATWEADVHFGGQAPAAGAAALTLDGAPFNAFGEGGFSFGLSLCSPQCDNATEWRSVDACHFTGFLTRRHNIDFAGGTVEFDLRYGASVASTEPGQFERAVGTLDGTDFQYTSYWDLVYTPGHHHFVRHFMVLFDAPIGSACALAVEKVTEGVDAEPVVKLIDCELGELETRVVTGSRFLRLEP